MESSHSNGMKSTVDNMDMDDPFAQYVYGSMMRIEGNVVMVTDELRKVGSEIQALRDEIRRQEKDRTTFQGSMLAVSNMIRKRLDDMWSQVSNVFKADKGLNVEVADYGKRKSSNAMKVGQMNADAVDVELRKDGSGDKVIGDMKARVHSGKKSRNKDEGTSEVQVIGFKPGNVAPSSLYAKDNVGDEMQFNEDYIRHKVSESLSSSAICPGIIEARRYRVKIGPFNLKKPFPAAEHAKVIQYIYDERLDSTEDIVVSPDNFLSRMLLYCLKPGQLVNGEVINVISEFLTMYERKRFKGRPETWYLPTRMTPESMLPEKDCKMFVKTFRMKEKFMGPLFGCKQICIPVNTQNHWLLLRVMVEEGVVEIWDSLLQDGHSVGERQVDKVMKVLDEVLAVEIRIKGPLFAFSKFRTRTMVSIPQQRNSFDCGVFMINFLENRNLRHLMEDRYESEDERARLVLKIVLSSYNSESEHIVTKARGHKIPLIYT